VALKLYTTAAAYAESRGVILADTKFEFGLIASSSSPSLTISDSATPKFMLEDGTPAEVILADEVLTPDSSRFWPQEKYERGRSQPSFDKQYLRDWLTASGFKKGLEAGLEGSGGWTIADSVVRGTQERYEEAWKRLSGEKSDGDGDDERGAL
jgi:phosphoribosylaminoimidazole-succinocarboxamide synthase